MSFSFNAFKLIRKLIETVFHLELPKDCFEKKLRLGHPYNIIINRYAAVGHNVTIHQNVTIGSKQFGKKAGVPTIEDNVIIYSQSVILGKIRIGKDSIIGAGSVVIDDVPPCSVVAGNPARLIGRVLMNMSERGN
jgi:serine acetyltransferase